MSVQFSAVEASVLLQLMNGLPLATFDSPSKKSVLNKLLSVTSPIDLSKCIGGGDGVIFMLENVAAGDVVVTIKALRAATGWGLKEAKDAFDAADPFKRGGTLGPFRSDVPSFEMLTRNFTDYRATYNFNTSIRFVLA